MPAVISLHPSLYEAHLARQLLDSYTRATAPQRDALLGSVVRLFGPGAAVRLLDIAEFGGDDDGPGSAA